MDGTSAFDAPGRDSHSHLKGLKLKLSSRASSGSPVLEEG